MGAALLDKAHGSTVIRHEVRCSAALVSHAWSFHREAADIAKDVPVHIYSVRGDATNTRVLQNTKLHNLEVEAFHLTQLDLLDPREEPDNQYSAFAQNLAQADLQLVRDGTGHGIYTLSSKQIRSVGAPT